MVFGQGGGLLQKINRDTQRFAFKSSAQKIAGEDWRDIFKDPIEGGKSSKKGVLGLVINDDGEYNTVKRVDNDTPLVGDQLQTVFKNGELLIDYTFDQVVANSGQ